MKPLIFVTVALGRTTSRSFAPAVPAAITAVMLVDETTVKLVTETPPNFTLLAPSKFVPEMVIAVPPSVVPNVGDTNVSVGTDMSMFVNAASLVSEPLGVVTTTSLSPTVPAGAIAIIEVAEATTKLVAETPPTVTLVAPVKLVPLNVRAVPPVMGPLPGATDESVGAVEGLA